MVTVTCNNCGWVHFAVQRQYAEDQVHYFNEFFDKSDQKTRDCYGNKKSSIAQYEHCFRCNNTYKDFRPSKDSDCPIGCTIQPIIQDNAPSLDIHPWDPDKRSKL